MGPLLHSDDDSPFVPERFQIVVRSFFHGEQVDNNVAKVNQDPTIGRCPFNPLRHPVAALLRLVLGRLHQRPELRFGITATNDEIVSKDRLRMEVQHENVDPFLLLQRINQ